MENRFITHHMDSLLMKLSNLIKSSKTVYLLSILFIISISASISFAFYSESYRAGVISSVSVRYDINLYPEAGVKIAGHLYLPKDAIQSSASESEYPAVILQHGIGSHKGNMASMAINFVKRGFVVAAFDLRRHGESTGYFTFGVKESDDLVYAINYLKSEEFASKYVKISQVGLVGHSIGAVTVIMTSYKSGVNSCVAISPAAFISNLLNGVSYGDLTMISKLYGTKLNFSNPDLNAEINLTNYVINRTIERPYPKTRNLLVITGMADTTVPSTEVSQFFSDIVGVKEFDNFTLYGSFKDKNATRFDIFNGSSHGSQQYTFDTPKITLDAINWTEHALLSDGEIASKPALTEESLIMDDLNKYSSAAMSLYYVSFVFLFLAFIVFLTQKRFGTKPAHLLTMADSGKSVNEAENSTPSRLSTSGMQHALTESQIYFLFSIVIAVTGVICSQIYIPGIIGLFLPEIAVRMLAVFTIPLVIGLLFFKYLNAKHGGNTKDENNESNKLKSADNFEPIDKPKPEGSISGDFKIKGLDLANFGFGLFSGIYLAAGVAYYAMSIEKEELFKPIVFYLPFLVTFLLLFIIIESIQYISASLLGDSWDKLLPDKLLIKRSIIVVFLIALSTLFGTFFDKYTHVSINYPTISVNLFFALNLAIPFLFLMIGLVGKLFYNLTGRINFFSTFTAFILAWLLFSLLPTF